MERIDLDTVVRTRLPRHYDRIPRWLIRGMERLICQEKLNALLDYADGLHDEEFCRAVIEHLDVGYSVRHEERLPIPGPDARVIFTCNHPLGALDGMIIIDMLARRYGRGIRFVVNDLLNAVEPLRGVWLPVNKHGAQSRESAAAIERAMDAGQPVIVFPAGLCSRASWTGRVADLEWNKMFVLKAIRHRRDIVPLHFDGRNSAAFYIAAKLRALMGIRLNIEMLQLPREIFKTRGHNFTITVGERIPWQSLAGGRKAAETAASLRRLTYQLTQH